MFQEMPFYCLIFLLIMNSKLKDILKREHNCYCNEMKNLPECHLIHPMFLPNIAVK